jgi:hypothetical protein
MPLPNNQWEEALATLQPGGRTVMRPGAPGNTGNIPYAPGMMRGMQAGARMPLARELYQGVNPGAAMLRTQSPYAPAPPYPGSAPAAPQNLGGGMGATSNFSAPQARGLTDALRRLLAARGSVAATRGSNTPMRFGPSPLIRY